MWVIWMLSIIICIPVAKKKGVRVIFIDLFD